MEVNSGNDLTCEKKGVDDFSLNSGTIICNFYTGRQSHMCLSVSVFELTEPELPPRQGTEAAGSSNATANTRTAQFFKLNLR